MLTFAKYEGAGNDFLLIDDRDVSFLIQKETISSLCDRRFGIGADGIILLQPDFRMRMFNRDGSEAETCGNGLRCLGRFIQDLGIFQHKLTIQTLSGKAQISFVGDLISVDMGEPKDLKMNIETDRGIVHFVDTGVPHLVQFVNSVEEIDLPSQGFYFRHHAHFQPKGANVNFAELQSDGSFKVRTFERGVEGETLACGSGACAVAYLAKKVYDLSGPVKTSFPGGDLRIEFDSGRILMTGEANRVFQGSISLPELSLN